MIKGEIVVMQHDYDKLLSDREELLAACKATMDYLFLDKFLEDSSNEDGHVWAIRKEHLLAIRAAISKASHD
jgi:hypothetical protein